MIGCHWALRIEIVVPLMASSTVVVSHCYSSRSGFITLCKLINSIQALRSMYRSMALKPPSDLEHLAAVNAGSLRSDESGIIRQE